MGHVDSCSEQVLTNPRPGTNSVSSTAGRGGFAYWIISHVLQELCVSCDNQAMKSYRADAARREMRDILSTVERGEPVEIKRYDTPTAIVVSPEWYDRTHAALAAFREAGWDGSDPPVSGKEVRSHALKLWGLISSARKYTWSQEPNVAELLADLDAEVGRLADLLPENVEAEQQP